MHMDRVGQRTKCHRWCMLQISFLADDGKAARSGVQALTLRPDPCIFHQPSAGPATSTGWSPCTWFQLCWPSAHCSPALGNGKLHRGQEPPTAPFPPLRHSIFWCSFGLHLTKYKFKDKIMKNLKTSRVKHIAKGGPFQHKASGNGSDCAP